MLVDVFTGDISSADSSTLDLQGGQRITNDVHDSKSRVKIEDHLRWFILSEEFAHRHRFIRSQLDQDREQTWTAVSRVRCGQSRFSRFGACEVTLRRDQFTRMFFQLINILFRHDHPSVEFSAGLMPRCVLQKTRDIVEKKSTLIQLFDVPASKSMMQESRGKHRVETPLQCITSTVWLIELTDRLKHLCISSVVMFRRTHQRLFGRRRVQIRWLQKLVTNTTLSCSARSLIISPLPSTAVTTRTCDLSPPRTPPSASVRTILEYIVVRRAAPRSCRRCHRSSAVDLGRVASPWRAGRWPRLRWARAPPWRDPCRWWGRWRRRDRGMSGGSRSRESRCRMSGHDRWEREESAACEEEVRRRDRERRRVCSRDWLGCQHSNGNPNVQHSVLVVQ